MGRHCVVCLTVSLLLLPIIKTHDSKGRNLQAESSHAVDVFDRSGGSSKQVTSSTEVRETSSSTDSSVEQKQFPSNETSTALRSTGSLQHSSEGNNADNLNALSVPINNSDMVIRSEGKSEFLQQSDQSFSALLELYDHLNTSNNGNVSNLSHFGADHLTPQQYTGDVFVNADYDSVIVRDKDNGSSPNGEESSAEPFADTLNRRLNDTSTLIQNQPAAHQNNPDVKENQYVNLDIYNRSESQSQVMNESIKNVLSLNQEQSDSLSTQYLNNSFDSEETFEQVFNISLDDSEQSHYFGYQADSEGHTEQSLESSVQVSESNTELGSADNGKFKDLSLLNNVFEVHHYSRTPHPNDADVAKPNKTLAQHIEELVLKRLPSLDTKDKSKNESQYQSGDETGSEYHEENDIPLGVEVSPDEIGDSAAEETYSGVSLAFVFDATGSMWDDLVQVKTGAERIMATMLERPDKPIHNYVLVPFHDPSKLSELHLPNS